MKDSGKFIIPILAVCGFLCLHLANSTTVSAAVQGQGETPQSNPTVAPTLPVELYSQTATPWLDGGIRHVVLEGQFLYNIVELYGVSLQEILTLNNLTEESIIYPGDILVIVKGGEIELGQGTQTPEADLLTAEIGLPTPSPTTDVLSNLVLPEEITPEPTPGSQPGFFQRIFSNEARFLALGVLGLVLFGVVLVVIGARRIH